MTQDSSSPSATDCIFETIVGLMLPFFLTAAGGNQDTAKAAIRQLMENHNAGTTAELDLVGRMVVFSIVSLDNLRLSVTPGLSATKMLRYRSNAATLSRASDQVRKILAGVRAGRDVKLPIPRPAIAAAPPVPKPVPPANATPVRNAPAASPSLKSLLINTPAISRNILRCQDLPPTNGFSTA